MSIPENRPGRHNSVSFRFDGWSVYHSSLLPFFPSSLLPFFPSSLLPFFPVIPPRPRGPGQEQSLISPAPYARRGIGKWAPEVPVTAIQPDVSAAPPSREAHPEKMVIVEHCPPSDGTSVSSPPVEAWAGHVGPTSRRSPCFRSRHPHPSRGISCALPLEHILSTPDTTINTGLRIWRYGASFAPKLEVWCQFCAKVGGMVPVLR